MIKYSFVIPVYNRPDEVRELLRSFAEVDRGDYEIILVEDGSTWRCDNLLDDFASLRIRYHYQPNAGPGPARNKGASLAQGEWLIFLDSDTLLSEGYFEALACMDDRLDVDYFGGPDASHPGFAPIQRAIGYSMTSWLSTGGIRGRARSMEKFKPRSFNMGIKRVVFELIGGFAALRFGEDMDLSIRLEQAGYRGILIPDAVVYHKRRTTFRQFFKQVFNSGMARVVLSELHPGSMGLVHGMPLVFVIYHVLLLAMLPIYPVAGCVLLLYPVLYLLAATWANRSVRVGMLSVGAVYVQLFGYAIGFWYASWKKYVLRQPIRYAFRDNFYEG